MKKYSELPHGSVHEVTLYGCKWTIIHWYYVEDEPVCILMHHDPYRPPLNPVFETVIGKEDEQYIMERLNLP